MKKGNIKLEGVPEEKIIIQRENRRHNAFLNGQKDLQKKQDVPYEELKNKTLFNTVEHKTYPCLVAEQCIIYHDPKTSDRKITYLTNENVYKKDSNDLKREHQVKVQYKMGVLNINETIVLSPETIKKPVQNDSSFKGIVALCHRYVF